jgi:hypothetical protein
VLANSEIWQIEEPDGLSLYQRCQRVFDLPVGGPFPQVWVSTNLASGAEVAVSVPGSLHRTLVFSAAQELGQFASRTAADLLGPENGESWLEQAKAEEPPAFDYTLLRVPQEPEAVQPPEKTFSKSASAQARLWWMAGYAASNLLTQLQGHGLAVAGVTPDGVALYWGLERLWQEANCDLSALGGPWALVEDSDQPSLWLYSGPWFQRRLLLDSLDALQTLDLEEQTKIVLWPTTKDTVEALADSLAETWTVFDNTLSRWSRGRRYPGPTL